MKFVKGVSVMSRGFSNHGSDSQYLQERDIGGGIPVGHYVLMADLNARKRERARLLPKIAKQEAAYILITLGYSWNTEEQSWINR